jgi:osmotically-inducible protein OsmY
MFAPFRKEVKILRFKSIALAIACGLLVSTDATKVAAAQDSPPPPDNTKTNQRDRSKGAATAGQAKNNAADRDIMQKIRRSVMDDKSLSTYAHNVKIISQDGKVTLKGPVRSEEEKQKIETIATGVAGAGNVTNEITVKPAKKS